LQLHCDESRSQHKNRDLVVKRFFDLLKNALTVPKKRKPTKPTRSSVEKRLKSKKQAAEKKSQRKKPGLE
jgi:ribosome-associated protein